MSEVLPPALRRRSVVRGLAIFAGVLLGLGLLLLASWHWALRTLEQQVLAALGPESTLSSIDIRWPGIVVVSGLRIAAPEGWPETDTLRAERIEIVPDLRSLATERVLVRRVSVTGAYLSVLRNRQGSLQLLPTLLHRARRPVAPGQASKALSLGLIEIDQARLDFHDQSLPRKPVHLHIEPVHAAMRDLRLPELSGQSALEISGTVRGAQRDGSLDIRGWLEVATRESDLQIRLDNVDLVSLEPYLIKASESGVRRGGLSLDLHSQVRGRQLKAPGTLLLRDLQLKSSGGVSGTFMGMPRQAVIGALKSGGDQISLSFSLDGNLDNPQFSLNETLSVRVAVGVAQSLGVGLVDIVRDVGSLGGRAIEATGNAIGKLFGGDE